MPLPRKPLAEAMASTSSRERSKCGTASACPPAPGPKVQFENAQMAVARRPDPAHDALAIEVGDHRPVGGLCQLDFRQGDAGAGRWHAGRRRLAVETHLVALGIEIAARATEN